MELEGLMTCTVQQMECRLNSFLTMHANMLKWTVYYKNTIGKLDTYKNAFDNRLSQFSFGHIGHEFIIGRNIREEITSYVVSPEDFRQSTVYFSTAADGFNIRDIAVPLNQSFRYRAIYCRSIVMHASAVVYNGKVFLFTGISGAGKSTQAQLWRDYAEAEILNYDQVLIFVQEDSVKVCGTPWAGKENVYKTEVYPLQAIILIEKADYNWLKDISKGEAFSRVYLNNYLYPLNEDIEDRHCELITQLISKIPVYAYKCTIDKGAVRYLQHEMFDRF